MAGALITAVSATTLAKIQFPLRGPGDRGGEGKAAVEVDTDQGALLVNRLHRRGQPVAGARGSEARLEDHFVGADAREDQMDVLARVEGGEGDAGGVERHEAVLAFAT